MPRDATAMAGKQAKSELTIAVGAVDEATRERLMKLLAERGLAVAGSAADPAALAALLDDAPAETLVLLSREMLDALLAESPFSATASGKPSAEDPALTPRELEVLGAIADGASNKMIARRLGISFHTVKFHVASILEKLDADSRTEAVAEAARRGLVML